MQRLLRAFGVSSALCLVLASSVFVEHEAVRAKLVEDPIPAVGGQVALTTGEPALALLPTPFAVVARLKHGLPRTERFEIHIDGRLVCSPRVGPGQSRRVDCAQSAAWTRASVHHVAVRGPTGAWTLEYLEFATHHGATRAHDLLIVPGQSWHVTRPGTGWMVVAWLGWALLFLLPGPARLPRAVDGLYKAAAIIVVGLLAAVVVSRLVTPFAVLMTPRALLRAGLVLAAPRLWTAGVWLAGQSDAGAPRSANSLRSPATVVLVVSGLLGFRVGMIGFPSWHVAVETAQVVAGLVVYPTDNPFYLYHVKLWTGLHQVLAGLLRAGVSESTLSLALSGVLGMVSFQALSIVVYACSRDAFVGVASTFLIFASGAAESGTIYPIALMGTTHTYGALGLSWVVLAAGLLGAGYRRTGGFLSGLAPAVHPSIGLWFALIVAFAAVSGGRQSRVGRLVDAPFVLAGCAVTLVSFAVHLAFIRDVPPVESELAGRYLSAFVSFWDGHRRPVAFTGLGVALNAGILALALLWMTTFVDGVPRAAAGLFRIVAIGAALSLGLAALSWAPPDLLPAAVLILMPGRMLNFSAMIAPAVLIGLIAAYKKTIWGGWLLLLLAGALLLNNRSMVWSWIANGEGAGPRTELSYVLGIGAAALVAGAWFAPREGRAAGAAAARVASMALMAWTAIRIWNIDVTTRDIMLDRTNNAVFAAAAETRGMLATAADLHLVQLRTRRPVLLDGGGLDGLPYAIEGGPGMERILRDVYAVDFFNPPEEARGSGTIPRATNRAAWQQFAPEEWQQIRRAHDVTHVLAYAEWKLGLPVVARDSAHVLYRIPSGEQESVGSPGEVVFPTR
jgi:hypothetical protein